MKKVLKIDSKDNVVTCLQAIKKGDVISVDGKEITANEDIGRFHKIAIKDLNKGDYVYKYGQVIGDMLDDAKAGDFIHTHNVESTRGRGDK
ncbi:UxaA family hydrolase [uncultured Anaerococcus sp.]|uniref:UxaA family hydrolase n=1 Tax=uncultured Anaerococcus sp. TaxID=293428 RepID=UPI002625F9A0|nr:UxaA family hydrolase [uncultured Anaerococcus sp.]